MHIVTRWPSDKIEKEVIHSNRCKSLSPSHLPRLNIFFQVELKCGMYIQNAEWRRWGRNTLEQKAKQKQGRNASLGRKFSWRQRRRKASRLPYSPPWISNGSFLMKEWRSSYNGCLYRTWTTAEIQQIKNDPGALSLRISVGIIATSRSATVPKVSHSPGS